MSARTQVKGVLQQAGLLDLARDARDFVAGVPWWAHNSGVRRRGAGDGLPLPPLRLVRAATGTSSLDWMLEGGRRAADSIAAILARNGIAMREVQRLLDFGCGCGRVIRHWHDLPADVHGCDYNATAIRWCQRHLPFATFACNGLAPPLPYGDGRFDLVYALSVFTHLPEPLLFDWMREMERVLAPGGLLVASTHGDACLGALDAAEQAAFRAGQAVVKDEPSAGTNRCGVYVSEEYVRSRMAEGFEVLDVVLQGARGNPPQDLTLFRKPPR
jgi:SAM-dependent methyltransferase